MNTKIKIWIEIGTIILTLLMFSVVSSASFNGLVAEYHFDEGSGNILKDSSGNGNNGTIYGATWTANGKFGSALQFDGINDYVEVPDSPGLSGGVGKNITVEYWFKSNRQDGEIINKWQDISYKDWGAGFGWLELGGAGPFFWYENNGYDRRFFNETVISEGLWHHGAFTFQASTGGEANGKLKMYSDGNEIQLLAYDGVDQNHLYDMPDTDTPVNIGYSGHYYNCCFYNGTIDEIKIYDRVLSADEIRADYNRPTIVNFKLPLSGKRSWLLTVQAKDGKTLWGGIDQYHVNRNALDFDDVTKENGQHYNVPILAAADGTVVESGYSAYNGNYVKIRHNNLNSTYLHLANLSSVNRGNRVIQGQQIGILGDTGNSFGSHVHFEIQPSGATNFLIEGRSIDYYKVGTLANKKYYLSTNRVIYPTVTSPNGGETWNVGTTQTIRWSIGDSGPYVKIILLKGNIENSVISSSTPNNGYYTWTIPLTQPIGSDYQIRIVSTSNAAYSDRSDSNFIISSTIINLLKNPGFETSDGVEPTYWDKYQTGTRATFTYPEIGRTGGKSVAIKYTTKEIDKVALWWQPGITVSPSSRYKLSGYMRLTNVTGGNSDCTPLSCPRYNGASLRINWVRSDRMVIKVDLITKSGTSTWAKYEGTFTAPSNAVKVYVGGDLFNSSGKVWFDDLSFAKVS